VLLPLRSVIPFSSLMRSIVISINGHIYYCHIPGIYSPKKTPVRSTGVSLTKKHIASFSLRDMPAAHIYFVFRISRPVTPPPALCWLPVPGAFQRISHILCPHDISERLP